MSGSAASRRCQSRDTSTVVSFTQEDMWQGNLWQENELQKDSKFELFIFLPLIFLPDLTSAIRRLRIFASEQEINC